jgi:hypothetical protein
MKYLTEVFDTVTSLPVDVIIGAVFVALMLTSPVGLTYAVGRRSSKEVSMALVALAMATNLVGMALAIGQARRVGDGPNDEWARSVHNTTAAPLPPPRPPAVGFRPPDKARLGDIIAERIVPDIFSDGDTDHDGRLSTLEAAAVAIAFIESPGPQGVSISAEDLRKAIAEAIEARIRSLFRPPFPPGREMGPPPGPVTSRG